DRFPLLEALYSAGWKLEYGFEPSEAWADLARMLLERQQTDRAVAVAERVTAPRTLLALRVDKRFDALVSAHPERFDVDAAVRREIGVIEKLSAESPRSLQLRYELIFSVVEAGQYRRALKMADDVLAGERGAPFESRYDDSAEFANWILDARAHALLGLGKWTEAQRYFEQAAAHPEEGRPNVSNAINLAMLHAQFGRSRQALDALGPMVLDDKGVSPYGGMQIQHVLLLASLASHDKVGTQSALDFMRDNQLDSLATFQTALVSANALDEAAGLMVRRLKDPALRADALAEVQDYRMPPMTPAERTLEQHWRELMARSDVKETIEKVGRVERFSIPPITR
ncbi:MAG TPA: tetratricopeptide repeat protein, partial [Steroidobacteraceae bacterium]